MSPKTIRDIWNKVTWAKATRDLWTDEEVDQYLQDRKRKSCKLDPSLNLPSCSKTCLRSSGGGCQQQ